MIKLEAQTCQSAEDIHPLWRDLTTPSCESWYSAPTNWRVPKPGLLSQGYDSKVFELRTMHSGEPVSLGAKVAALPRSDYSTVEGGSAPHKPSSTGRVYVEHGSYYPSTFGLQWVELV